jgi:putative transposase
VQLIQEAVAAGCRVSPACQEAEICPRTYRRWIKAGGPVLADQRPDAKRPAPQNKLSNVETREILTLCNQPEYASLPPSQIVPKLADQGIYVASESSFYRVLRSHDQLHHRGRTRIVERRSAPASYTATASNQVWTWDSVP